MLSIRDENMNSYPNEAVNKFHRMYLTLNRVQTRQGYYNRTYFIRDGDYQELIYHSQ